MKPNVANCDRWRTDWALEELHCPIAGECFPPDIYVHNKAGTDFQNFSLKKGTLTTRVIATATIGRDQPVGGP